MCLYIGAQLKSRMKKSDKIIIKNMNKEELIQYMKGRQEKLNKHIFVILHINT
jgi:hypothetical protein